MKVNLRLHKDGAVLYEGSYDVSDPDSFGKACANVWNRLREQRLAAATSIGALFEELDQRLLDHVCRAEIRLSKV